MSAPAMRPEMSFLTLPVPDVAAAVAFYGRLGWAPLRQAEDYAFFALGGLVLALVTPARLVAEGGGGGDTAEMAPMALLSHNVAAEEELAPLIAAFCAAGGRLLRPAGPTPWGGARALVEDPSGLRWELVWNPRARPAPGGGLTLGPRGG
jgi:catechol 2,3-dioxygenase-like lactoylglutathione lyase family enzyme